MAVDSAMLDHTRATGQGILRCYGWNPHTLSFGRHEPALRRYDVARIRAEHIPTVRRPTGGRAVWHARELTYAVAAPLARFGGMREAYAAIHGLLAAVLGGLGATARLAPRNAPVAGLGSGPCFATPVGGEVLVEGRKVVGSAQLRAGDSFLQHGSLLLGDDQSLVHRLAGLSPADPAEAALDALLGREIAFVEAAQAVIDAAGAVLEEAESVPVLPASIERGAVAHLGLFSSDDWTWRR